MVWFIFSTIWSDSLCNPVLLILGSLHKSWNWDDSTFQPWSECTSRGKPNQKTRKSSPWQQGFTNFLDRLPVTVQQFFRSVLQYYVASKLSLRLTCSKIFFRIFHSFPGCLHAVLLWSSCRISNFFFPVIKICFLDATLIVASTLLSTPSWMVIEWGSRLKCCLKYGVSYKWPSFFLIESGGRFGNLGKS